MDCERLDFHALAGIAFEEPDTETFRGLPLAIRSAKTGGSMPTVFNAANEEAVALFLSDRIRFTDIYRIIEEAMESHAPVADPDLDTILQTEQETRAKIKERWC